MYRGRFAPSPTGRLHFGSLVTALGSWLCARAAGGTWIVRMEDLDPERTAAGAAQTILATLHALGLDSDEPVLYQGARGRDYALALRRLATAGHAYRCWCSRNDLEAHGGIHPAHCVAPARDRPPAWRLRTAHAVIDFEDALQGRVQQDLAGAVGDFVIWRADGSAAYQLAVVVDDAAQGITDVVRGADLLDSTPRQILLQRLLGYPTPAYAHLPLALDSGGHKLAKHLASLPVDRTDPLPALAAALAFLNQPVPRATTPASFLAAALEHFDLTAVPRHNGMAPPFAAARKDEPQSATAQSLLAPPIPNKE
ncbi:tRNA glutamyl-Q(34) synthetase GluQRS [Dokdonella sp.]|uniref:tRNA glutamyl-Q(34) synthetase GluQRS n=1 Tax=Dokdonella sp. TaxID=2291710 RepID=UPI0031C223D6|nr:tRNA glutamyl-Q(34) synthetase GluQRS [Dokdonella sp.]